MTDVEMRFWDKVRIGDGCWEWTAAKVYGYGKFLAGRRQWRAHRMSWVFHTGQAKVPDGAVICHTCDNRSCVRPSHLRLGTQQDNMDDMWSKGRGRFVVGSANGVSKLTEAIAAEVKAKYRTGMRQCEISREMGLSAVAVHEIVREKKWRHV